MRQPSMSVVSSPAAVSLQAYPTRTANGTVYLQMTLLGVLTGFNTSQHDCLTQSHNCTNVATCSQSMEALGRLLRRPPSSTHPAWVPPCKFHLDPSTALLASVSCLETHIAETRLCTSCTKRLSSEITAGRNRELAALPTTFGL